MKLVRYSVVMSVFVFLIGIQVYAQQENKLLLWYEQPATDWMTEALPIGNGYVGAMFYGDPFEAHIQFSEGTLWSGGPGSNKEYNYGMDGSVSDNLGLVRQLLKEGKNEEANKLVQSKFTGKITSGEKYNGEFGDYGAQQTMGDIFVKVLHKGVVSNYKRSLDISKALGKVAYEINGEKYRRTYFANYPSNVMVYGFRSSIKTDYEIKFNSPHVLLKEGFEKGVYSFQGKVADNDMGFETKMLIKCKNGKVWFKNGVIYIDKTTDFYIVNTSDTDYKLEYPTYSGIDFKAKNKEVLKKVSSKSFNFLKKEHVKDYQNLFNRVSLNLGDVTQKNQPTDARLETYYDSKKDPGMEVLYFQYARYLMIAGSRPKSMSMHLQGKWNSATNPIWAADYHSNINLQMIYWPAEITNLSECHEPFLDYISSLVTPGKLAATSFFNTRGWMVNTMCNAFGYTSPGWGIPWGFFPGGAGWFSQHYWEHFDFTQDQQFLKEKAYPVMKEAALFWIDYLTKNKEGAWVSSPSYSPEHGGISTGASMDHQIAWDLLNNCIKATEILKIDTEFRAEAIAVRDAILKPKIGNWGQLQEWTEDVDDPNNTHRHVSHLFALYPGKQISRTHTPLLAEAAKVSLLARGDGGTGWSRAWKLNFWARLKDGNHAHKMLRFLMTPVQSKKIKMTSSGGTYPNLLCAHPPFQLDGNMGGAAGIAEMLLQSHMELIELLPALPDAWPKGAVSGLKARGAYEVAIKWEESKVTEFSLKGPPFKRGSIRVNGAIKEFELNAKGSYKFEF